MQSVKGFRGDFVAYQEVRDYSSNFLQLQNVFNNILAIATVQTNWYNNENKKTVLLLKIVNFGLMMVL